MSRWGTTQRSVSSHGWHLEGLRMPTGTKVRPLKSWKNQRFDSYTGFELVTSGMTIVGLSDVIFGVIY